MFVHLAERYGMVLFGTDIVNEIWDSTAQNLHCRNNSGHRAWHGSWQLSVVGTGTGIGGCVGMGMGMGMGIGFERFFPSQRSALKEQTLATLDWWLQPTLKNTSR